MKPYIYIVTPTTTAVAAGASLPLTTPPVRRSCNTVLGQSGNAVTVRDCYPNLYEVEVNATFTVPVAGNVTLTAQQNGTDIPGGTATTTVATATTAVQSLSFTAPFRATRGPITDTISIANTGVAATFSNVSVIVRRVG